MNVRYRVAVAGLLPRAVAGVIEARFGRVVIHNVVVHPDGTGTALELAVVDQPALRALLTLLWDAGHEVRSLVSLPPKEPSS